jgi:hypothetical protein
MKSTIIIVRTIYDSYAQEIKVSQISVTGEEK